MYIYSQIVKMFLLVCLLIHFFQFWCLPCIVPYLARFSQWPNDVGKGGPNRFQLVIQPVLLTKLHDVRLYLFEVVPWHGRKETKRGEEKEIRKVQREKGGRERKGGGGGSMYIYTAYWCSIWKFKCPRNQSANQLDFALHVPDNYAWEKVSVTKLVKPVCLTCKEHQSRRLSVSISIGMWLIWVAHVNQWLSRNLSKPHPH